MLSRGLSQSRLFKAKRPRFGRNVEPWAYMAASDSRSKVDIKWNVDSSKKPSNIVGPTNESSWNVIGLSRLCVSSNIHHDYFVRKESCGHIFPFRDVKEKLLFRNDTFKDSFKEFEDMTIQFYVTMQRVLQISETKISSIDIFSRECPEFIKTVNSNSFERAHGFRIHDPKLSLQMRSFSSNNNPDVKNKQDEQKDMTTTASSQESTVPSSPKTVSSKKKDDSMSEKAISMLKSSASSLASMIAKTPGVLYFYMTHPKEFKEKMLEIKEAAKKEAHHYYMGSKLLIADIKTARQILVRTLNGTTLTRRERKQLLRTVTDVFRLVPMSIFVLIPFMEFALPLALKIWPNMLPSTFQDNLKAEENMKRELKSRLAMAEFFQETLQDLAKAQKKRAVSKKNAIVENDGPTSDLESIKDHEETAESFLSFIEKARKGEFLPPDAIIRYAKYFKDELTLDNMPRMQLINMCRYMNIPPYGNDNLLRFQLRHKIRVLQEDDQRILWEGIHSLTKMELREACQERGMRSTGLSKEAYVRALQQWIDLSVNRNVPISLLIMSRIFFLQEEMTSRVSPDSDGSKSVTGLADAISGMEKEVLNNVILESVSADKTPEFTKLKLEVLKQQNELIEEEKQQRESEAAKKAEREKLEQEKLEKEKLEKETSEKEKTRDQVIPTVSTSDSLREPETSPISSTISHISQTIVSKEEFKSSVPSPSYDPGTDSTKTTSDVTSSKEDELKPEDSEDRSLSSEELDAISQIVSPDPVSAERATLESIKAALQDKGKIEEEKDVTSSDQNVVKSSENTLNEVQKTESIPIDQITIENADQVAAEQISQMDKAAEKAASESTTISYETVSEKTDERDDKQKATNEDYQEYSDHDRKLDMAIKRLKSKVESMVGNLEIQISDVEAKIGDKMHLLDKDMDGILSREEMAITLQSVLKRPLTFDEAMAIAADMDENKDGLFSVDELSKWLESTKLVKLVEEGKDAEVDKIISSQAEKMKDKKKEQL